VPAKRLLDALGIELVKLIKVRADRGVAIEGDDLLLDPNRLLPPPQVVGKVGTARLEATGSSSNSWAARRRPSRPLCARRRTTCTSGAAGCASAS